jgi:hypothetical protein
MLTKEYLNELRQGILNELQSALEKVQQAKGAIALIDTLLAQMEQQETKNGCNLPYAPQARREDRHDGDGSAT